MQTHQIISHHENIIQRTLAKLSPRHQIKNPVMFVVSISALLTTVLLIRDILTQNTASLGFNLQVTLWLWFTVLFANFAEALAESREKTAHYAMTHAKSNTERALNSLLAAITIILLIAIMLLRLFAAYSLESPVTLSATVALLICLIPTTISGLLHVISISDINQLLQQNIFATNKQAIEVSGKVDVLLVDKTGIITHQDRIATAFIRTHGIDQNRLIKAAYFASFGDDTPEGNSILQLIQAKSPLALEDTAYTNAEFIAFTPQTRTSGAIIHFNDRKITYRKGAMDAITRSIEAQGGRIPLDVKDTASAIARSGGTPLVITEDAHVLGVVELKNNVKGGIRPLFARLHALGIRTVMMTGDHPLTAAAIAAEVGFDDFLAEATPQDKFARICAEQANGQIVATTGSSLNDALALAKADLGIVTGDHTQQTTQAAGNMLITGNDPLKLIEMMEIGRQLLTMRRALITFSIANDVAKFFAMIPAVIALLYPTSPRIAETLSQLNIMQLSTPQSAILSTVIFNALIILALIPLVLHGQQDQDDSRLLQQPLFVYGISGLLLPFVSIKLIDLIITALGLI